MPKKTMSDAPQPMPRRVYVKYAHKTPEEALNELHRRGPGRLLSHLAEVEIDIVEVPDANAERRALTYYGKAANVEAVHGEVSYQTQTQPEVSLPEQSNPPAAAPELHPEPPPR